MLRAIKKYWYIFLKQQDYLLGVWSCSAMKWRGYSSRPLHPKHLFDEKRSNYLHEMFQGGIAFLDLGSGVGTECLLAAENGANVSVGLEGNWDSIVTSVKRSEASGQDVCFMQIDLENGCLPFADQSFDLVNFSNVLEHLHNRQRILTEIKRVKKKDGLAVFSVPNADTTWKKKLESVGLDPKDDPDHKIEYSKKMLIKELQSAGLTLYSELRIIIPSFPWNGLIAISAVISPKLYKRLQEAKRRYVKKHPDESMGWEFTVK